MGRINWNHSERVLCCACAVFGGFTTGGGRANIPRTVIAGRGSGYNWFVSVQAEPGGMTSYFDFDNRSEANAVIGHDNTPHGAAHVHRVHQSGVIG